MTNKSFRKCVLRQVKFLKIRTHSAWSFLHNTIFSKWKLNFNSEQMVFPRSFSSFTKEKVADPHLHEKQLRRWTKLM